MGTFDLEMASCYPEGSLLMVRRSSCRLNACGRVGTSPNKVADEAPGEQRLEKRRQPTGRSRGEDLDLVFETFGSVGFL